MLAAFFSFSHSNIELSLRNSQKNIVFVMLEKSGQKFHKKNAKILLF
tara:strand:+ start:247 stop:387 length:141 start_codon:yes stop_codon:yes gene_type:complete